MKPCDCKSIVEVEKLMVQGISLNNESLSVDSAGVYIYIRPYVKLRVGHANFKRFAEWYLKDQVK